MSSAAGVMMVMMMGIVVCCMGGASSIVALVNEKIIQYDFLDFLLIPGWGKGSSGGTGGTGGTSGTGGTATTTVEHCKDTAATECAGTTGSTRDTCVSKSKASCIARGGTWTSSIETYPKDCIAGAKTACSGKTGKDRDACTGTYKTKCVAAGGYWGDAPSGGTGFPPGPPPPGEWREGCYYMCKSPVDPKYDVSYTQKASDKTKCVRNGSAPGGFGPGTAPLAAGPWEINSVMVCPN